MSRACKLCEDANINTEHEDDLESTMQYMEEHRIPELFNELLTRVLMERPEDARYRMVQMLRTVQKIRKADKNRKRAYHFMEEPNE